MLKSAKIAFALFLVLALSPVLVGSSAAAADGDPQQRVDHQVGDWLQTLADQAGSGAKVARRPAAQLSTKALGDYTCLPTCGVTDGKFLSIAGSDLQTLASDTIQLRILVPSTAATFDVGFFDGDSGGVWDLTQPLLPGVPLEYTLIADPDRDGTGPVVAQWDGSTLPDNAWADFTVATDASAAVPSGAFSYLLQARSTNSLVPNNWSNFKVRTSGSLSTSVTVSPVAFAFTAPLFGGNEGNILYPNAGSGDFTTTTYDGVWRFYLDSFQTPSQIELWDGDFDRGTSNVPATYDTDDPNTPGIPYLPPWADPISARPEGVAFVLVCGSEASATGCPADDRAPAAIFRRSPSIEFTVTSPDGQVFLDGNPSGNREWEKFLISTAPFDASVMDYSSPALPPGVYTVQADGVDLSNLNAWRFFNAVLGVCENDLPCVDPPRPYLIGDTVFYDNDGDGLQDAGDAGIAGVLLQLVDYAGTVLETTTTDASGKYVFDVEKGTYEVVIDASSFDAGGPLAGTASTTGGETITDTVVDDNVLTYDFGYRGLGSIGDRVWYDTDGNGAQNAGEAGINGVTVTLRDGGGNVVATQVTSGDGGYLFTGLVGGNYTVTVDSATLPAGYVPTYDLDGVGTAHTAAVTLSAGQSRTDVDFGYTQNGSIGDRVWRDTDRDGVQDAGEAGVNGVTVTLRDGSGNVVATKVTAGDGNYLFENLSAGTYSVTVDASTLPSGLQPTYDLDGLATPNRTQVSLAAGQNRLDVDFGYAACGACSGKVSRLTLRYDGASTATIVVKGKRGPSTDVLFTGTVAPGGTFEIVGPATGNGGFTGTVGTEIDIYVNGAKVANFHTSCSQPIGPGSTNGAFTVLAGASKNGGPLCPLNGTGGNSGCSACSGGVKDLTLIYDGSQTVWVKIKAWKGSSYEYLYTDWVSAGDEISIHAPSGSPFYGTLGDTVKIYYKINGQYQLKNTIDVTCATAVGPGYVAGDFEVVSGASKNGGVMCPVGGGGGCSSCGNGCLPTLDFDKDAGGSSLARGTKVAEQWASQGIHVTTQDPSRHPAMIFDSAHPTGGDWDLGTPNETFGGPGIGNGGRSGAAGENRYAQGNVLIVSENGSTNNPDDDASGGTLIFTFDQGVKLSEVELIDIEESGGRIKAFNAGGGEIASVTIPTKGNNGYVKVAVVAEGVRRLEIKLAGSGAVSKITFCPGGGSTGGTGGGSQPPVVGAGNITYWKTHSSVWPVSSLTIGAYTFPKSTLIDALGVASQGNKAFDLAKQLVAAKLNVEAGADGGCIDETIAMTDLWLEYFGFECSSAYWAWTYYGADLYQKLDDYNNGRLCAPHRD